MFLFSSVAPSLRVCVTAGLPSKDWKADPVFLKPLRTGREYHCTAKTCKTRYHRSLISDCKSTHCHLSQFELKTTRTDKQNEHSLLLLKPHEPQSAQIN